MRVGLRTDIGRVRQSNEDGYLVLDGLFAVADGMGGHRAGEVASALALGALGEAPRDPDARRSLAAALQAANEKVFAAARRPEYTGMGTTLTAARIDGGRCTIAHVGDSRAYLVRGGVIRQLTEDHSVAAELVRRGEISADEAETHPHRHLLTRALGTQPHVQVDLHGEDLAPGDVLVLCTDGLTGLVADEEIRQVVTGAASPQEAADRLVELANSRGGWDNVTVLVVECGHTPVPAP